MTALVTALAVLVVILIIALGLALLYSRLRARHEHDSRPPAEDLDRPDSQSAGDLLPRLTEEVRKCQAEAAYWKQTAQRLQHELDHRDG
jgi:ABC-type nickel/cobalt efflux system permease component RcnA